MAAAFVFSKLQTSSLDTRPLMLFRMVDLKFRDMFSNQTGLNKPRNSSPLHWQVSSIHRWVRALVLTIIAHMEVSLRGGTQNHGRFNTKIIIHDLDDLGKPYDLGNHHIPKSWNASP